MNLLNYVDRYSFFAAGTKIQEALHIDDKWFGVLGVSFMIVYTLVSPAMGWMGDRYSRKLLLAGGVGLWSFATVFTAFSADFYHMFFWRALLGLGEASYGAIAPALIADLFPVKDRGRAMGVYYLALPVGSALGYILGGTIAVRLGWQAVFFVVGLPGLLVALAGLVISEPERGASEGTRGLEICASAQPERIPCHVPHPDFPLQYRGHGGRDIRHRRIRGVGINVLSTDARSGRGEDRDRYRPPAGRRGSARDRPGDVPARPPAQGHASGLPPLRRGRRSGRHASGRPRHPRPRLQDVAGIPLWCVGAIVDGARTVQHGDGQRGSLEPTSHWVRLLHLSDPPVWRHQLAHPAGMDLEPVRQSERNRLADWSVLRCDRRQACG